MITYPKIQTLYQRAPESFKVMPQSFRFSEFWNIKMWLLTEKIDGTNIRIGFNATDGVQIGGRTNNAALPHHLSAYLHATFTEERMRTIFDPTGDAQLVLFGEGYGPKIQKGGGLYRSDGPSFRLFDVWINGWWMEWEAVEEFASTLGIKAAPVVGRIEYDELPDTANDLRALFLSLAGTANSIVSLEDNETPVEREPEGVIARTMPLLRFRNGERLMWKLKFSDFPV